MMMKVDGVKAIINIMDGMHVINLPHVLTTTMSVPGAAFSPPNRASAEKNDSEEAKALKELETLSTSLTI